MMWYEIINIISFLKFVDDQTIWFLLQQSDMPTHTRKPCGCSQSPDVWNCYQNFPCFRLARILGCFVEIYLFIMWNINLMETSNIVNNVFSLPHSICNGWHISTKNKKKQQQNSLILYMYIYTKYIYCNWTWTSFLSLYLLGVVLPAVWWSFSLNLCLYLCIYICRAGVGRSSPFS